MQFQVTRTSHSNDKKPCDGVKKKKYDRVEVRTVTEDQFDKKVSSREGAWRSKGINHDTCENGKYIKRTFPNDLTGWFINFDTLEDLCTFSEKHGSLIFTSDSIEIYDDYRE